MASVATIMPDLAARWILSLDRSITSLGYTIRFFRRTGTEGILTSNNDTILNIARFATIKPNIAIFKLILRYPSLSCQAHWITLFITLHFCTWCKHTIFSCASVAAIKPESASWKYFCRHIISLSRLCQKKSY